MDRGYTMNRSKGQNRRMPKRRVCPHCNKRGIGQWQVTGNGAFRECRYCHHIEHDKTTFEQELSLAKLKISEILKRG